MKKHETYKQFEGEWVFITYLENWETIYIRFREQYVRTMDITFIQLARDCIGFRYKNTTYITKNVKEMTDIMAIWKEFIPITFDEKLDYQRKDLIQIFSHVRDIPPTHEKWMLLCKAYRNWYPIGDYKHLPFSNADDCIIIEKDILFNDIITGNYEIVNLTCEDDISEN